MSQQTLTALQIRQRQHRRQLQIQAMSKPSVPMYTSVWLALIHGIRLHNQQKSINPT